MQSMRHGSAGRAAPLQRYTAQLGRLVEQRMSMAALLCAKQDAEHQATQAHTAMLDAKASNEALRNEIQHRVQTQARLTYLASHDPLTGLPNRSVLCECLALELEQARRSGSKLALLYLDLDHFKDVNDTLGHAVGDALLKEVARRLQGAVRGRETVARMGGDEFAILQGSLADPAGAHALAQRLIAALRHPIDIASRSIPRMAASPTSCSATPTWRCTAPSRKAATATISSTPC